MTSLAVIARTYPNRKNLQTFCCLSPNKLNVSATIEDKSACFNGAFYTHQRSVHRSDFLQQMLPHHQGVIMMAKYELMHGRDFAMIQLAKSILAEQQTDIRQMNLLLKEPADMEKAGAPYQPAMAQTMDLMMSHLPEATSLSDKRIKISTL